MKKIISIMFIALMCVCCFSSYAVNNAVEDNITTNKIVCKYVSEVSEEYPTTVTYNLNGDMTFTIIEVDLETNEVNETLGGKWSFDKDRMEITFIIYDEGDIETYTANVSNDFKTFTIIFDEDSEYEVYNKINQ